MTITHSYTKLVAVAAGVAVAFALVLSAAAPVRAASLTPAQVQTIIGMLQAFGVDATTVANVTASLNGTAPTMPTTPSTGGSMACKGSVWARDLTVGATGADVMALQKFLNMSAATQVAATGAGSPGMETSTFGPATKAAVMKFQTANAITPAAGYVGPVTRTTIAAKCSGTTPGMPGTPGTPTPTPTPTTPTTPVGLTGGEGNLLINSSLGDVETDVDEGDSDVEVLGAELEADDSDMMVERVDVDITVGSGGSAQLDNYIDSVSIWLDGKKLATQDVKEGDEDSNDVFSFRFTGLKGVIREGDKADLYVSVDAINNIDSGDTDVTLDIDIPTNGIRAVDGAGISETYVDSSPALDGGFSVTTATVGDLEISEGDKNPEGTVVMVDEDDDTDDVLVMEFDIEAGNQDVVVDAIPVGLVVAGGNGTTVTSVSGPVKRAILKKGNTVIDTVSIPSTAVLSYQVLFDDLDLEIADGDTETFSVYVDLNDADPTTFATSSSLYATTTGSDSAWDVEDSNGDSVTPGGAVSNSGETLVFQTEGIEVKLVSATPTKSTPLGTNVTAEVGSFQIVVDIKANDGDMWIDKDATADPDRGGTGTAGTGFQWATTTQSTTGTTTIASVLDADGSTGGDSATGFKINEGETRRFTLTVSLSADINGVTAVQLTGINYDTDSTVSDSTTFYTSNLSDFKTALLTLLSS